MVDPVLILTPATGTSAAAAVPKRFVATPASAPQTMNETSVPTVAIIGANLVGKNPG